MLLLLVVSRWRQRQEALGLVDGLGNSPVPLVKPDKVEEVAMFSGRRIDPVADRAALGLEQPDIEAAPGRSGDIADHPVAPFAPSGREIVAANRIRVLGKPFGQVRDAGRNSTHVTQSQVASCEPL